MPFCPGSSCFYIYFHHYYHLTYHFLLLLLKKIIRTEKKKLFLCHLFFYLTTRVYSLTCVTFVWPNYFYLKAKNDWTYRPLNLQSPFITCMCAYMSYFKLCLFIYLLYFFFFYDDIEYCLPSIFFLLLFFLNLFFFERVIHFYLGVTVFRSFIFFIIIFFDIAKGVDEYNRLSERTGKRHTCIAGQREYSLVQAISCCCQR